MTVLTVLGLVSLLAGRAGAVVATCRGGCKTAAGACNFVAQTVALGCKRICSKTWQDSDRSQAAHDAFVACRMSCRDASDIDKMACSTTFDSCVNACQSATDRTCAEGCGVVLLICALNDTQGTNACRVACGGAPTNGGCIEACGTPGSVALHQGEAALADCYNNPANGFTVCMNAANSACTAQCGNGTLEPGEECDDNNLFDGDGCSHSCTSEDVDGDGILALGNRPSCAGGATAGCDDNCPYQANANQADADGDGTGDLCDYNCTAPSGSLVDGGVYLNSVAPSNALADVALSACDTGAGCCSYTMSDGNGAYQFPNLQAGTYLVKATASGNILPGGFGVTVPGPFTQNIILHAPTPLPPGTTLGDYSAGQHPSVVPSVDQTLTVTGCAGGTVTWSIVRPDLTVVTGPPPPVVEGPPGTYTITIPAGSFALGGPNQVSVDLDCGGGPVEIAFFDVYIDPSGFTKFLNGSAAVGATVTLLRADTPLGPFVAVPDGSAIMSPKNRTNPDTSDGAGHFGWDVMAGYYQVRAERGTCVVESSVLQIPPAVTDLDLVFQCPCISGPLTGCRTAATNKLVLANDPVDDGNDSFLWKWSGGQTTTQMEFGSPMTSTSYDVCVYAGTTIPLVALDVPVGPAHWALTGLNGATGYKYVDAAALSTGLQKVILKGSAVNRAKVVVQGTGLYLPDPALGGLATPVTIQLQPSEGSLCFESTFALGNVIINSGTQFKAKKLP
jgi:cysteine-rich repeat protein